jgi:hypothetical protein
MLFTSYQQRSQIKADEIGGEDIRMYTEYWFENLREEIIFETFV